MTLTQKSTLALFVTVVLFTLALLINSTPSAFGSTPDSSSDYMATSTAPNSVYGGFAASRALKAGSGSFGSVIITGSNTGAINIYNATTSNVNLRTGNLPTSTILIASLPASLAAGTYVFDASYTAGLYVDLVSGTMPTSTITYR